MENVPSAETQAEARERVHKALGEMLINITDQVFTNRNFYIDGYRFINCSFIDCTLVTLRGTFEFHRCRLTGGWKFSYEAMKSVQLYHTGTQYEYALDPFKPKVHDDGTISIGQGVST
jgi:hypothetical protein